MRKSIMILVLTGTVISTVGSACSSDTARTDVIGTWVAEFQSGTESLTLNGDGTYRQEILIDGEPTPTVNSGTWTWEDSDDSVLLVDCLGVNDGRGDIRADFRSNRGACSYPAEPRWFFFGDLILGSQESAPFKRVGTKD